MAFKQALEFAIDVVDKASSKFEKIGHSAKTNLGGVETHATGIGGAFEKAAAKSPLLTGALDKVGLSGQQAGSAIQSALPGAMLVAGGAVAAFGVHAVGKFQDLAGAVLNFQRIVGGTAEESSAFVAVLDDYEISAEAGATAIGKMAKIAANTPASFEKFGVEIAKNADGTTNLQETLLNAAEAYQNTGDDATKAALGAALFGKGYATLIPILEKGKDGANGLAEAFANVEGQQILSQDQIDQAESFRLTMDRLQDAIGELSLAVGSALVPVLEDAASAASSVAEGANKATAPIGGLDKALGLLIKSGRFAIAPMFELTNAMIGWSGVLGETEKKVLNLSTMEALLTEKQVALTGSTNAVEQALGLEATAHSLNEGAALADKIAAEGKGEADAVAKEKADAFTAALDAQRAAADALYNATNSLISSDLAYRNSVDSTEGAVLEYNTALLNAAAAAYGDAAANEELDDATRGAEAAIIAEAAAAVAAAEDQATLAGKTLTAAEKADIQKAALEELKNKFPELNSQIQGYINKLNAIPKAVHTNFTSTIHAPGGGQATGGTFEDGEIRHAASGVTFLHVGEQGPEDVALFGNGRVLNRADTIAAGQGGQRSGGVHIENVNLHDAVDVDLFAQRLMFALSST